MDIAVGKLQLSYRCGPIGALALPILDEAGLSYNNCLNRVRLATPVVGSDTYYAHAPQLMIS